MCLNNSLLIALLVASGVKGISRKIMQNVLDSYCSQELKQQCTFIQLLVNFKRRLDDSKDLTITDCHRECIFQDCKLCGKTKLHEKIASENKETIDWEKSITWHQWKTVKSEKNEKRNLTKYCTWVNYHHYLQYFVHQLINCQPICFTFGGRPYNLKNVRNNSKKVTF